MPMVRAMRMLNAVEAGTTSGAQLEALLIADPGRLAELNVLLGMRGQARRVAASSTAMTAVAASSTAMTAVAASSTAMTAVIASSTAMTAVAASSTAMTAVAASSTAMTAVAASSTAMTAVAASSTAMTAVDANDQAVRIWMLAGTGLSYTDYASVAAVAASSTAMTAVAASSTAMGAVWASNTATDAVFASATARLAVYNSDTALSALQATPTQVQRKVTSGSVAGTATSSSFTYVANGTKIILLRVWTTGGSEDLSLVWGRGLSSNDVAGGVRLPNGDNLGSAAAAIGRTTTYGNSGAYPSANTDNANVVSAANGLMRRTWSLVGNTTQNVRYILV